MSLNSKLHFTGTQGKGYMPDGTSRMTKDGKEIFHFMGCSTFAEYAVIAEISAAKIHPGADLYQMCLLGCGLVSSTPFGFTYQFYTRMTALVKSTFYDPAELFTFHFISQPFQNILNGELFKTRGIFCP